MQRIWCILTCIFLASTAMARECGLPKDLNAVLFQNSSETVQQTILSTLSKSSYEDSKRTFGADFNYSGLDFNLSEDSFKSFQQALRSSNYSSTLASSSSEIFRVYGDPQLVEAYKACLGAQPVIEVKLKEKEKIAIISVRNNIRAEAKNAKATIVSITSLTGFGATVRSDDCKVRSVIEPGRECQIIFDMPKDALQEILFAVSTDIGEGEAYLPPRRKLVIDFNKMPIPQSYVVAAKEAAVKELALKVVADNVGFAEACTVPLPAGHYIYVTKDNPRLLASPATGYEHGQMKVSNARIQTEPGLRKSVCFQYYGQWQGGGAGNAERSFIGRLQGDVTAIEWRSRY